MNETRTRPRPVLGPDSASVSPIADVTVNDGMNSNASGRKADDALVLLDQPVAGERSHGLGVERCGSPRCGGDEPQRVCAALAKRAFEAGLLPERLVASAARRALRRQRTGVATRNSGKADRGAEIEESL